jgi:hypothetical protein
MPGKMVYLESSDRTQELLSIKWALRSAGFVIGSNWHDSNANSCRSTFEHHWNALEFARLQECDTLVILAGETLDAATQIAMMTGFALARSLEVCWIGRTVGLLESLAGVHAFDTADEFRRHLLTLGSERTSVSEKLGA